MNVLKIITRLKALHLYHLIDNDDDYKTSEQKMMNPEIMSSINNNVITDDEALSMANDIFLEFIENMT